MDTKPKAVSTLCVSRIRWLPALLLFAWPIQPGSCLIAAVKQDDNSQVTRSVTWQSETTPVIARASFLQTDDTETLQNSGAILIESDASSDDSSIEVETKSADVIESDEWTHPVAANASSSGSPADALAQPIFPPSDDLHEQPDGEWKHPEWSHAANAPSGSTRFDGQSFSNLEYKIREPMNLGLATESFDIPRVIRTVLENSPAVRLAKIEVGIAEANTLREQAAFDWTDFIESNWAESNQPVASTLDGAADRVENHNLNMSVGTRRSNRRGGNFSVQQDLGFSDSNSEFFDPNNQALANIAINFEQPLLRGRGMVATSQFRIAQADTMLTKAEFINQLQTQILNASDQYWELAAARGEYHIQKATLEYGRDVVQMVKDRVTVDTNPQQLIRAKANLVSRERELVRSKYALISAQERFLQLLTGNNYSTAADVEIVTTELPAIPTLLPTLEQELQFTLSHRPEIKRELASIRRASIEQGVAKNQLLPALDLAFSISNRGLRGNQALASAFNDQFNFGDPTYSFGLNYSLPRGNRAAKASEREAELRIARFRTQMQQTVSEVSLELKLAHIEFAEAIETLEITNAAFEAAFRDYQVRVDRYELGVDDPGGISGFLDNLFSSQDRLASAQRDYIRAYAEFCKQDIRFQRVRGSLLSEPDQ